LLLQLVGLLHLPPIYGGCPSSADERDVAPGSGGDDTLLFCEQKCASPLVICTTYDLEFVTLRMRRRMVDPHPRELARPSADEEETTEDVVPYFSMLQQYI
jgi:hypothetical protein